MHWIDPEDHWSKRKEIWERRRRQKRGRGCSSSASHTEPTFSRTPKMVAPTKPNFSDSTSNKFSAFPVDPSSLFGVQTTIDLLPLCEGFLRLHWCPKISAFNDWFLGLTYQWSKSFIREKVSGWNSPFSEKRINKFWVFPSKSKTSWSVFRLESWSGKHVFRHNLAPNFSSFVWKLNCHLMDCLTVNFVKGQCYRADHVTCCQSWSNRGRFVVSALESLVPPQDKPFVRSELKANWYLSVIIYPSDLKAINSDNIFYEALTNEIRLWNISIVLKCSSSTLFWATDFCYFKVHNWESRDLELFCAVSHNQDIAFYNSSGHSMSFLYSSQMLPLFNVDLLLYQIHSHNINASYSKRSARWP